MFQNKLQKDAQSLRALLGVFVLVMAMVMGSSVQADAVGQVSKVQLTAYGIQPQGNRSEKLLSDGVVMRETLQTVPDGGLQVSLIDDTSLTLGGDASLIVDEMVYDPATKDGNSVLKLATGTFLYVSGAMNKKGVNLQTPTATIGLRGTKLLIDIAPDGTTSIGVIEGGADVTSKVDGAVVAIEPGDSATTLAAGGIDMATLADINVQDLFVAALAVEEAKNSIAEVQGTMTSRVQSLASQAKSLTGEAKEKVVSELNVAGAEFVTQLEQARAVLTTVEGQEMAARALSETQNAVTEAISDVSGEVVPAAAVAARGAVSDAAATAAKTAAGNAAATAAARAAADAAAQAAADAAAQAAAQAAADAAAAAAAQAAADAAAAAAAQAAADAAAAAAAQAAADAAAAAAAQAAADAAAAAAAQAAADAAADAAAQAAADAAAQAAADAAAQAAADAAAAAAAQAAADAAAEAAAAAASLL